VIPLTVGARERRASSAIQLAEIGFASSAVRHERGGGSGRGSRDPREGRGRRRPSPCSPPPPSAARRSARGGEQRRSIRRTMCSEIVSSALVLGVTASHPPRDGPCVADDRGDRPPRQRRDDPVRGRDDEGECSASSPCFASLYPSWNALLAPVLGERVTATRGAALSWRSAARRTDQRGLSRRRNSSRVS